MSRNLTAKAFTLIITAVLAISAQDRRQTMQIVYPQAAFTEQGGPIIDLTKPPYEMVGDGETDNTAAFKAVLNYLKEQGEHSYSMYLPNGTYMVSDRLIYDGSAPGFAYFRLIGQNRDSTVIKLKDNCTGFGAGAQREVIACYKREESHNGGKMWGNQIRNLTVNTGAGNPGAIGIVFLGANACSMDNITISSEDGQGWCGLFLPSWAQQGHLCDITVEGFDRGIRTQWLAETNPVFEYITLKNQNKVALEVNQSAPCIRKFLSVNTVEAVKIDGDGAHCVILDSELRGGQMGNAAIVLADSSRQQLFVRNVSVSGYGTSVSVNGSDALKGHVKEWLSGKVFRIDSTTPPRTLNLPVEEVPLVPREADTANWANPDDYSGNDAEKIQAAFNSGKPAIYFPRYFFVPEQTILTVPSTVKQMDFMHQNSWLWGGIRIDEASSDPLFIEHSGRKLLVHVNAQRTVVARFGSLQYRVLTDQPVVAHFQNIAVLQNANRNDFCPPNATVYCRSINEEAWYNTNFVVNGGTMWVMGFKTESHQTAFHAKNGGILEVLGGYVNFAGKSEEQHPDVLNEESNVSYIGTNHFYRVHWEGIYEVRDGVTHKLLNDGRFPRRYTIDAHKNNYFVPLYVGYDSTITGKIPTASEREYSDGGESGRAAGVKRKYSRPSRGRLYSLTGRIMPQEFLKSGKAVPWGIYIVRRDNEVNVRVLGTEPVERLQRSGYTW